MRIGLDTGVLIASVKRRGEKYHDAALRLSVQMKEHDHVGVASSLVFIEVPGALASSTKMPIQMIYEVLASVLESYRPEIMPYEGYIDRTVDLIFELRDLKRRLDIGAADFHHLATSIKERCDAFVTVDERHLLNEEFRSALSRYVRVLNPEEASSMLAKEGAPR